MRSRGACWTLCIPTPRSRPDRKSTRLNSSHLVISYAVFCLKKKIVIHAVDYSRKDGVFATSELNFFLGKNFLVTYHEVPLRSVQSTEDPCCRSTSPVPRAPD